MSITPKQIKMARASLGWSPRELAKAARLAVSTVADFERGARTPYPNNLAALRAALEGAGVIFVPENGGGPGVRLKKQAGRSA